MELSVKSGNYSARLQVDTSARALVVKGVMGDQRINLFSDTRIEVVGDRLLVGAREFVPYAGSGRAPTIMDVQEFAKLLKQVAGSAGDWGASTRQSTQSNTSGSRSAVSSTTNGRRVAEARHHFKRAAGTAAFVEVVGFVGAILSAIGGLVIAFSRDDSVPAYYGLTERYPFLIEGITIGVFGAFSMLSISMVAAYIRGRAAEKGI